MYWYVLWLVHYFQVLGQGLLTVGVYIEYQRPPPKRACRRRPAIFGYNRNTIEKSNRKMEVTENDWELDHMNIYIYIHTHRKQCFWRWVWERSRLFVESFWWASEGLAISEWFSNLVCLAFRFAIASWANENQMPRKWVAGFTIL